MRCCPIRTVQSRLLALGTLALAACSGGALSDPGVPLGTVTLHLTLPSTQSFCDVVSACGVAPSHVSLRTVLGQTMDVGTRFCSTDCTTCMHSPCPAIPACNGLAVGQLITDVETSWDGSHVESGTCGGGTACVSRRFVPPGVYVAHMCATPGTVNASVASGPPCVQTGDPECVDVPFDLPGPSPVEATLPTGAL
jgi:hypothetical protein